MSISYPLRISPNRRYLVDRAGTPILLQGDAAWSLFVQLSKEDAEFYLEDRSRRGFNSILVNLIEHWFASDPPKNFYGEAPFTIPNNFAAPNEKYFKHVDWVIDRAAEYNIQVLLAPTYLGAIGGQLGGDHDQGWIDEILAAPLGQCLEYGHFLGERYANFDNIIWVIGGDRDPTESIDRLNSIAEAIKETDSRHLFTAHPQPERSTSDQFTGGDWLDFNATYTYEIVHKKLLRDYNRSPTMPTFLLESTYENEHNASEVQLRRQAYWSVLCGGFGHVFGCWPIWGFGSLRGPEGYPSKEWKNALNLPGSVGMTHWGDFFRSIRWYDLVPDQKHQIVTRGLGEFNGLDFVSSAISTDGNMILAYLPVHSTITVDMTKMNGAKATSKWFNPSDGTYSIVGDISTNAAKEFTSPTGDDWLLVLETK